MNQISVQYNVCFHRKKKEHDLELELKKESESIKQWRKDSEAKLEVRNV